MSSVQIDRMTINEAFLGQAFDSVNLRLLLDKLRRYGIAAIEISWI